MACPQKELSRGAWRSQYELILYLKKGRRPSNHRNLGNVQRVRRPHRGYATEKPVELLKTLIDQSNPARELLLDPFCGSGNVGVAARTPRTPLRRLTRRRRA